MDFEPVERLARAILHEGYLLYPYRASALKNRYRWTFGCVFPPAWDHEPSIAQTECLVLGGPATTLSVRVRFFQLGSERDAVEREVSVERASIGDLVRQEQHVPFAFVGGDTSLTGEVDLGAEAVAEGAFRARLRIRNLSPFEKGARASRDDALVLALLACHALLGVEGGGFVSLLDPPVELRAAAAACHNLGLWPVLAGAPGRRDILLATPIILEDHPRIAVESPGDLFDATEIDELLSLRILTLTEGEKREMAEGDERTRALLKRTEALTAQQLLRLHGACVVRQGAQPAAGIRVGSRVRLRPRRGGDVWDLALAGRTGVVAAIDEDHEGKVHLSVVVEDDPGMDLGLEGKPGHRFFFSPDEVEVLDDAGAHPGGGHRQHLPG